MIKKRSENSLFGLPRLELRIGGADTEEEEEDAGKRKERSTTSASHELCLL